MSNTEECRTSRRHRSGVRINLPAETACNPSFIFLFFSLCALLYPAVIAHISGGKHMAKNKDRSEHSEEPPRTNDSAETAGFGTDDGELKRAGGFIIGAGNCRTRTLQVAASRSRLPDGTCTPRSPVPSGRRDLLAAVRSRLGLPSDDSNVRVPFTARRGVLVGVLSQPAANVLVDRDELAGECIIGVYQTFLEVIYPAMQPKGSRCQRLRDRGVGLEVFQLEQDVSLDGPFELLFYRLTGGVAVDFGENGLGVLKPARDSGEVRQRFRR